MSAGSRIVLLNGVGSAGETSIAKALQTITSTPFLHIQMDTFVEMLPEALQEHSDGFSFETVYESGKPVVVIRTGPIGKRALRGMRHATAAMAQQGNNLIVDDVMLGNELEEYTDLLAPLGMYTVGVHAPLDVLEIRERQRGDRLIGLARWQYDRVHAGKTYDLEIDTSSATPLECANLIKREFQL